MTNSTPRKLREIIYYERWWEGPPLSDAVKRAIRVGEAKFAEHRAAIAAAAKTHNQTQQAQGRTPAGRRPRWGTEFNGVPPPKIMRQARDERRRRHDQARIDRQREQDRDCGAFLSGTIPAIPPLGYSAITDIAVDPDIGALRIALENIDDAVKAGDRTRGRRTRARPVSIDLLRKMLAALEQTKTPLRVHKRARAIDVVRASFEAQTRPTFMPRVTIQAALRRLSDLRKRLGLRT